MTLIRTIAATALLLAASVTAYGADLAPTASVEEFHYSWRLRGGVRFLAGLMFPTSGVGNLKTTYADTIHSELMITAPNGRQGGFYAYESDMDRKAKTLVTEHGYSWGEKSRNERTVFDYGKGLARIRKETPDEVENRVKKLPGDGEHYRDILTAIYFLRQNSESITGPMVTSIFSDGKEYPVLFKPGQSKTFVFEGKNVTARAYEIVDAPGGKKWPGGVTVWVTSDDRRIPIRIEIKQSMASLQLDLKRVESAVMVARLN